MIKKEPSYQPLMSPNQPERRTRFLVVFRPQEDTCPACQHPLRIHETSQVRIVHDLREDIPIKGLILSCLNTNFPARYRQEHDDEHPLFHPSLDESHVRFFTEREWTLITKLIFDQLIHETQVGGKAVSEQVPC